MRLRFAGFSLLLAALSLWAGVALAQQETAPLQVVVPKDFKLPAQEGVTARLLPDGTAVSVAAPALKEAYVIDLGWTAIQPQSAYRARYRLRAVGLQEPANVYLMLREHEAKDVRPIQPYHRDSVNSRVVKIDPNGEWIERELTFVTGAKTQIMSGAIVVGALNGELQFGTVELSSMGNAAPVAAPMDSAQAWANYEKMMAEIRAQAAKRVPLTPRTLVFSRSQMKYGLERNYYHQWNDRPLLVNRDYREVSEYITSPSSYKRVLQEVLKYDIDGLAELSETKGRLDIYDLQEKLNVLGVDLMPEFVGAFTPDHIEQKGKVVERALKSPLAPRIDGKLLITSYDAQSLSPAEWKKILGEIRARVGDKFIFLPALTNVVNLRTPLLKGEPIPAAAIEKEKAFLREYLDVCDGIYFNYPPALRAKDHSFDAAFYRDVLIPVFKSVLAEPTYRHKYFGLSSYRSHMSPDRGNNLHEDYTRTLRSSFEAAMDARPEVIVLPEWDEQNENTSFRPTVYGGTTTERLLCYYMSKIKNKDATPVPGDDTSIPNLILSTRKILTLGEVVTVELVNVPDGTPSSPYQVELTLQDEAGKIVRKFEPVTFDTAKLQEQRFSLPSESLPDVRALVPVLAVRGYKGRDLNFESGFHHVQVRATWNWDYLTVRQPLRDLLRPTQVKLAWEPSATKDGPLTITGLVSSPEDMALVELMADDDEVFAVDAKQDFYRDDPNKELFLIEYRSLKNTAMTGALTLKGASSPVWLNTGVPLVPVETKEPVLSQRVELTTDVSEHVRWIYIAVPNANLAAAELDFDFDKAKFSVPLREVLAKQIIVRDFDEAITISVQPYRQQIDMPFHLNKREAAFQVQVWPDIATQQYHLRLTTTEGKIYRSRPLLLPNGDSAARTTLRVYSDTKKGGVDVPIAASRVPVIDYDFDPSRGAVLLSGEDRPFWASLGGFTSTTTGLGSPNGLFRGARGRYPEPAQRSAPKWVEEDGRPCLEFDGIGTYLELPRETLPSRGSFTLSFDLKPASDKDQYLLMNRVGGAQKGLALQIRGGKLVGTYADYDWKIQAFETALAVPAGQWSNIRVRHDFDKLTLSVNDKSELFPLTLPANNIGFTLIGEGWTGNWFAGRLRDLRVIQNAE
ncbi:MAG: LamG-like jellyroll fold domain-containing protein [Armatimonadota bacterium]